MLSPQTTSNGDAAASNDGSCWACLVSALYTSMLKPHDTFHVRARKVIAIIAFFAGIGSSTLFVAFQSYRIASSPVHFVAAVTIIVGVVVILLPCTTIGYILMRRSATHELPEWTTEAILGALVVLLPVSAVTFPTFSILAGLGLLGFLIVMTATRLRPLWLALMLPTLALDTYNKTLLLPFYFHQEVLNGACNDTASLSGHALHAHNEGNPINIAVLPGTTVGDVPGTVALHLFGAVVLVWVVYISGAYFSLINEMTHRSALSAKTAKNLAALMAKYDTDGVADVLTAFQDDPRHDEEFLHTFRRLLRNLESYKPHLPQWVLPDSDGVSHPVTKVEEEESQDDLAAIEDPVERLRVYQDKVDEQYEQARAVNAATGGGLDDVIDPAETRRGIVNSMKRRPTVPPREGKKYPYIDTW